MGQTISRRGGSAALAAGPSYDRRRGRDRRAAMPAWPAAHATPPHSLLLALGRISVPLTWHAAPPPVAGPSLRQDIPRPPLRGLLLRTLRRGALAWQRGLDRWQSAQPGLRHGQQRMTAAAVTVIDAGWRAAQRHTRQQLAAAQIGLRRSTDRAHARAAPVIEPVIAHLDARVWQPAMWLLLPAQRETLARAMAALSVAIAVLGWTALYFALAPTPAARPKAPPKQFTARVVSPAHPAAAMQKAEAPSVPADEAHDALALAAELPMPTAAPVPARHKARRATASKAAPPTRAPRAARSHAVSVAAY